MMVCVEVTVSQLSYEILHFTRCDNLSYFEYDIASWPLSKQ